MYLIITNSIDNNLISKIDIQICDEILVKSIYSTKEKRNIRQSDLIDTINQVVEV